MIDIHKNVKHAPGFKAWKNRLTLVLCGKRNRTYNEAGLVYRAKNPRALKNKNKNKKNFLRVFWQHNLKALYNDQHTLKQVVDFISVSKFYPDMFRQMVAIFRGS
jgi:hypothetical protein